MVFDGMNEGYTFTFRGSMCQKTLKEWLDLKKEKRYIILIVNHTWLMLI
jgi:hypothetical protein